MDLGDGIVQQSGRLDSHNEGYPGTADHMASCSVTNPSSSETNPSSPDMPASGIPNIDSHTASALECPLPQAQLQESRFLRYFKTTRECDTPNVDTRNGQSGLVQQGPAKTKPWPLVEREWIDERDRDIATLNTKVQNLELVADMWKDQYDSLTHAHNLEAFEMEFQVSRLVEQLQAQRLTSHNCQMNVLELENMIDETRLETEAYGNQLSSINNVYPQAAQMSAPVTTSGYPEGASGFGPHVQMTTSTDVGIWDHVSNQFYSSY